MKRPMRAMTLILLLIVAAALAGCARPTTVHETGIPVEDDPGKVASTKDDGKAPTSPSTSDGQKNATRAPPSSNETTRPRNDSSPQDPPPDPPRDANETPSTSGGNGTREGDRNTTTSPMNGSSRAPNDWRVGNYWHYRTDSRTGYAESRTTVLAVDADWFVTRYEVWHNGGAPSVNETRRIARANLTWESADNQPYFFPMVAGAEETFVRGATTSIVKVTSDDDRVTLDIGDFTTHRIVQRVTPPGLTPLTIEYWFADDVRNAVVWQVQDSPNFTRLVAYAT